MLDDPKQLPVNGVQNWQSGYLPPLYQGTRMRPTGSPVLNLNPEQEQPDEVVRLSRDLLKKLDRIHQKERTGQLQLDARIASYELAARMQLKASDALDLKQESKETLEMYGVGNKVMDTYARRCIMARRLVERGVRFVQIYTSGWDSHDYIKRSHAARMRAVDKPIAALIQYLKQRSLLDETLIVSAGEFGRSPDNGLRGGTTTVGRDHNNKAMTVWLAGGGVKAGHTVGATDEIGEKAVEVVHPIKDLHVTILHLLGLDDNKLTYFHEGRFKQLSQTGGSVIKELVG